MDRGLRGCAVLVHRWAGLATCGFLLVAGLTGSLLAWLDELEGWAAPQMVRAVPPAPGAPLLDPFTLAERVRAQLPPEAHLPWMLLRIEPGRTVRYGVVAEPGNELPYDDVFANPWTGAIQERRLWGDITQGTKNLMSFIYRLHYSLALDRAGSVLMGVVALVWTLDGFVGAWLTFPACRRNAVGAAMRKTTKTVQASGKPWLARWRPSWLVRWRGGAYKLNFDLHRAGGLWVWAMLFVLAWSSVAFNLKEVYQPVTRLALGTQPTNPFREHLPTLAQPRTQPALTPRQAVQAGRQLMTEQAAKHGFVVEREEWLGYQQTQGVYVYIVRSSRDVRERYGGNTRLFLDGDSGAFRGLYLPTGAAAGDTVTTWITALHMAALWGWPLKLFICAMGLVVVMLSVTGVAIWVRKRRARVQTAGLFHKPSHPDKMRTILINK